MVYCCALQRASETEPLFSRAQIGRRCRDHRTATAVRHARLEWSTKHQKGEAAASPFSHWLSCLCARCDQSGVKTTFTLPVLSVEVTWSTMNTYTGCPA